MWIQFTFDTHRVYTNSIRIETESSVKGPSVNKVYFSHYQQGLSQQIFKGGVGIHTLIIDGVFK